jgi:hypothetical protein
MSNVATPATTGVRYAVRRPPPGAKRAVCNIRPSCVPSEKVTRTKTSFVVP